MQGLPQVGPDWQTIAPFKCFLQALQDKCCSELCLWLARCEGMQLLEEMYGKIRSAWLCRSQEASVTRLAGSLLRGLHLAASLRAKAQGVIQLHALQKAPLSRACLRHLSLLLVLIKVNSPASAQALSSPHALVMPVRVVSHLLAF